MARFESLGESAFVNLARRALLNAFTSELWEVEGRDQVVARFKPAVAEGRRALGDDARFHVSVFVNRPEGYGARVALAVRLEPTNDMPTATSRKVRDNVAADLRRVLASSPLSKHPAKQSTVAAIRVPVDAAEGDTAAAAEAALPRLQEALDSIRAVEPVLSTWCAERLPGLLARHGSGHGP